MFARWPHASLFVNINLRAILTDICETVGLCCHNETEYEQHILKTEVQISSFRHFYERVVLRVIMHKEAGQTFPSHDET